MAVPRRHATALAFGALVGILLLCNFVTVGESAKDVPVMKLNNLMGPSLRFLYCYS